MEYRKSKEEIQSKAVELSEHLSAQEQSFFVAGFEEAFKWLLSIEPIEDSWISENAKALGEKGVEIMSQKGLVFVKRGVKTPAIDPLNPADYAVETQSEAQEAQE